MALICTGLQFVTASPSGEQTGGSKDGEMG